MGKEIIKNQGWLHQKQLTVVVPFGFKWLYNYQKNLFSGVSTQNINWTYPLIREYISEVILSYSILPQMSRDHEVLSLQR